MLWYQVEPFKALQNADARVVLMMVVLRLALVCIPLIPAYATFRAGSRCTD